MKKQGTKGGFLHKTNNRWRWTAGATAASAAGISASYAGLVTVNLTNNFISATGGNHLNADLTGDGQADLTIANAFNSRIIRTSSGHTLTGFTKSYVGVDLNGVHAGAFFSHDYAIGYLQLGSHSKSVRYRYGYPYGSPLVGSIPISFKDLHINNGKLTEGMLTVTVSGVNPGDEVQLTSFTYNTPDEGSSLALLAMGAAGVVALRKWREAQTKPRAATLRGSAP
jgi:hypothetical protein